MEGDDEVDESAAEVDDEAYDDFADADLMVGAGDEVEPDDDEDEDESSSTIFSSTAKSLDCPITPTQAYVSNHRLVQAELIPVFHFLMLAIEIL